MVRTLDLAQWAGRWVAIDDDDRVQRDAGSLKDLMAILDAGGVEGLSMRAPAPGEQIALAAASATTSPPPTTATG